MNIFFTVLMCFLAVLWSAFGVFMFYTTVRDDVRREKERKEKLK